MFIETTPARTATLALVKSGNRLVSLKAHYYPTYHIGADCSDRTVLTLWNYLQENVLLRGQFYNLLCRGSTIFDCPEY